MLEIPKNTSEQLQRLLFRAVIGITSMLVFSQEAIANTPPELTFHGAENISKTEVTYDFEKVANEISVEIIDEKIVLDQNTIKILDGVLQGRSFTYVYNPIGEYGFSANNYIAEKIGHIITKKLTEDHIQKQNILSILKENTTIPSNYPDFKIKFLPVPEEYNQITEKIQNHPDLEQVILYFEENNARNHCNGTKFRSIIATAYHCPTGYFAVNNSTTTDARELKFVKGSDYFKFGAADTIFIVPKTKEGLADLKYMLENIFWTKGSKSLPSKAKTILTTNEMYTPMILDKPIPTDKKIYQNPDIVLDGENNIVKADNYPGGYPIISGVSGSALYHIDENGYLRITGLVSWSGSKFLKPVDTFISEKLTSHDQAFSVLTPENLSKILEEIDDTKKKLPEKGKEIIINQQKYPKYNTQSFTVNEIEELNTEIEVLAKKVYTRKGNIDQIIAYHGIFKKDFDRLKEREEMLKNEYGYITSIGGSTEQKDKILNELKKVLEELDKIQNEIKNSKKELEENREYFKGELLDNFRRANFIIRNEVDRLALINSILTEIRSDIRPDIFIELYDIHNRPDVKFTFDTLGISYPMKKGDNILNVEKEAFLKTMKDWYIGDSGELKFIKEHYPEIYKELALGVEEIIDEEVGKSFDEFKQDDLI